MSAQLEGPFTIQVKPGVRHFWGLDEPDLYEVLDMNGLCVAIVLHPHLATQIAAAYNSGYVAPKENWQE